MWIDRAGKRREVVQLRVQRRVRRHAYRPSVQGELDDAAKDKNQ
jgi:hypothetical protein